MKGSGFLATALLAVSVAGVQADVLLMDSINATPENSAAGLQRPNRGASMNIVKGQFGEPQSMKAAVGEPPISRWIYPDYTVYFEHDLVLNVVVHR